MCLLIVFIASAGTICYLQDGSRQLSYAPRPHNFNNPRPVSSSHDSSKPPSPDTPGEHPIRTLIKNAQADFDALKSRQSTTLSQAVAEYKRRYGLSPPPNFDKWYAFAKARNVVLIDEFDTIHDLLLPFRGLPPAVLRERVREALGHDNALITVQIRERKITYREGGRIWMREALGGMLEGFIEWLPDMDLAFNVHDEPRVVVPHDDLQRLVAKGRESIRVASLVEKLKNGWSWHGDVGNGMGVKEVSATRFNYLPHQQTWAHSRLSCPPDSPSRSLFEEEDPTDANSTSLVSPLGFIANQTAYSDICLSPSFSRTYGFFAGANSYNVAQDLIPIFSQSKISSYQDILYPSPWYWYDKVPYDAAKDVPWAKKEYVLYWRGATTGGYSRFGNWRRQHRQRFVAKANSNDKTTILAKKGDGGGAEWTEKSVGLAEYKSIFDARFTEIGQCDAGDCTAQKQAFSVLPAKAAPAEAWRYKYLLDMDGNAFSGRFYSFLKSRSAVLKLGVSREWHAEWLRAWVHYVPLSLHGREWVEAVRWFMDGGVDGGRVGKEGEKVAERGSEWAGKALRNEDLEVWMFRLLLEYGRVVDDGREELGFAE